MNTKLRMLLPFLLLLCMHEAWAQSLPNRGESNGESTYAVGNGDDPDNRIPIYGGITDEIEGGHSQFIYPLTLLQSMGKNDIIGMTFYCDKGFDYDTDFGKAEFKVFLKEVDYTVFSSEEFIDWDGMTQVYAGTLSVSDSQMKITFDTPYTYQGKNLMVGFYITSIGSESKNPFWDGTNLSNDITNCVFENRNGILYRRFIPNTTFSYTVPDLVLADNADNLSVIANHDGKKVNATLQGRTLYKDNSWNTLCLPFAINSFTGTPLEGATVKTLSTSDFDDVSGTLTLNFSDDLNAIEAGVPYIVKWADGDDINNPSFEEVIIDKTLSETDTKAVTFEGLYSPCVIGHTTYAVAELEGTTLTFKVTTKEPNGETSWNVEDTGSSSMLGWESSRNSITKVVFDPSFAAARPKSCFSWFYDCGYLSNIEGIEYLNTSETTNMGWMFGACYYLSSIDLSHFDTRKVNNMKMMFYCFPGQTLDLSSFDTSNVEDMNAMFHVCIYLKTIYVSNRWSTAKVSPTSVFRRCDSLVGGANTAFDSSHDGVDYAHIDGGPDNPGYFTYKDAPEYEESTTEEEDGEFDNTLLYMGADNTLYYPSTSMTINAFRSIFRLKDGLIAGEPSSVQGINRFVLNFDVDETTDIHVIDNEPNTSGNYVDTWFTLDGQKLYSKPTRKGIYIQNGKKYIVK